MKPPPFKWAVLAVITVFLFTSLWVFAHMFRYEVAARLRSLVLIRVRTERGVASGRVARRSCANR